VVGNLIARNGSEGVCSLGWQEDMTSLAQVVSEVNERIRTADRVSLFLDFDGTLVPIEADPASPRLDSEGTETLRLLLAQDFVVTTILSGRAVADLYSRIRLEGLIYAGNHGLEIFGRNLQFVEPGASSRSKQLERLCDELVAEMRIFAGTLVEFKGLTASIHYRRAAAADRSRIEDLVRAAVARTGNLFRVNPGLKVFEIMPRTGWHKGAAVRWINNQLGRSDTAASGALLSVCLGDDSSDEEAFGALPDAITIRVGAASATRARYQLPDPAAVHQFLRCLAVPDVRQ
jgi:trehalose 6-phosphate phosphatase